MAHNASFPCVVAPVKDYQANKSFPQLHATALNIFTQIAVTVLFVFSSAGDDEGEQTGAHNYQYKQ